MRHEVPETQVSSSSSSASLASAPVTLVAGLETGDNSQRLFAVCCLLNGAIASPLANGSSRRRFTRPNTGGPLQAARLLALRLNTAGNCVIALFMAAEAWRWWW